MNINDNKTYLKRTAMVLMSFILVFGMLFVNSGGSMYLAYADSKTEVPNESNKGSEYKWFGYDSYVKGYPGYDSNHTRYHDLKVNLEGSKEYQAYCFNSTKHFPAKSDLYGKNWYLKLDGSPETFKKAAPQSTLEADELHKAITRVIYNGHPNNANGIMEGLEELNAILVTQQAVWYYTDDKTNLDSWLDTYGSYVTDQQKDLMYMKLKQLVVPELYEKLDKKVPETFELNIFMSSDKAFQNLLSGEQVPDNPPLPDELTESDEPTKTKVYISKVDGNDVKLKNAKLQVTGGKLKEPFVWTTTEKTHELELDPGSYTLKEIETPDGYITAEPIEFEVKNKKVFEDNNILEGNTIEIVNHLNKQPVKVRKVSVNDDGTELIDVVGAKIEIYDGDKKVDEWTTEKGVVHEIQNIEVEKEYTFKEVSAPKGLQAVTTFNFKIDKYGHVKVKGVLTSGNAEYKDGVLVVTDDREAETPEPEKEIDILKPTPEPYRSTIEIPKIQTGETGSTCRRGRKTDDYSISGREEIRS